MTARLVVSLSGVSTRTLSRCVELAAELDRRGVPLTLLYAPGQDGTARAVLDWVTARQGNGDAVLLRGGPGFTAAPAHEAGLRLTAAVNLLDRIGLRVDGFAPPRWLATRGTLAALRRNGFQLCAELAGVRDLRASIVHKGRVLGLGNGRFAEPWWCSWVVLGAARAARRGGLVRVALDARDLSRSGPRQAVVDAVDIALHHGATRTTYRGLMTVGESHKLPAWTSPSFA
jgi:predicted deacetylase